jgi:hypothetical protein
VCDFSLIAGIYKTTFAKTMIKNLTYQESCVSVISGMFNGCLKRIISVRLGPFSFLFWCVFDSLKLHLAGPKV